MNLRIKACAIVCALIVIVSSLSACDADKSAVVMTFRNEKITENMYSYWLSSLKMKFLSTYNAGIDSDTFWQSEATEGVTAAQYAKSIIDDTIRNYLICSALFDEYGLSLSKELTELIDDDINEKIYYSDGRSKLNDSLRELGVGNVEVLRKVYEIEEKQSAVYDYLYGTGGKDMITDSELDAFINENYSCVKYILIYTDSKVMTDENENIIRGSDGYPASVKFTDEELAEIEARIETVMSRIKLGGDFDQLWNEYDELKIDGDNDGRYLISGNELAAHGYAVVSAVAQMEEDEIRRVDGEYATYIIKKYKMPTLTELNEDYRETFEEIAEQCSEKKFKSRMSALYDQIEIDEELFSAFSIEDAVMNELLG